MLRFYDCILLNFSFLLNYLLVGENKNLAKCVENSLSSVLFSSLVFAFFFIYALVIESRPTK